MVILINVRTLIWTCCLLGVLVGITPGASCPASAWSPEYNVYSRTGEHHPDKRCSEFQTYEICQLQNFCCFNNGKCTPSNERTVECQDFTSPDQCRDSGCYWAGSICRRTCPATTDPAAYCSRQDTLSQLDATKPRKNRLRAIYSRIRTWGSKKQNVSPSVSTFSKPLDHISGIDRQSIQGEGRVQIVKPDTDSITSSQIRFVMTSQPSSFQTHSPAVVLLPKKTSSPVKKPTKRPTQFPTWRPTHRPTSKPTKRPTKVPTKKPTRKPSSRPTPRVTPKPTQLVDLRPTNSPTITASADVRWSDLLTTSSSQESNPTQPCSAFNNRELCQIRNYCCWDDTSNACFTPTEVGDLECPEVSDEESCTTIWHKECAWDSKLKSCRRRQPPVGVGRDAAWVCNAVRQARKASEDDTYCFVPELNKPCVFPFVASDTGEVVNTCVSASAYPHPRMNANLLPSSDATWCAVSSSFKLSAKNSKTQDWGYCKCVSGKTRPRSVLLIVADDLRTDLRLAYGVKGAITPNIDELVTRPGSVVFDKAYTQYAVCAPSRNIMFSGLMPDTTRLYTFAGSGLRSNSTFRARIKTLPQVFKDSNYYTCGGGKIFHVGHDDPESWNEVFFENNEQNAQCNQDPKATFLRLSSGKPFKLACSTTSNLNSLPDFQLANAAVAKLDAIVHQNKEPFFMAVGFYKPHTPYHVHSRFWSAFPLANIKDVSISQGPQPRSSYVANLTFDTDSGVFQHWGTNPWENKNAQIRKFLRTGYLAAIYQTDAAIGRIFDKLRQLKLEQSTLIVFLGDHGYFLGENNLISKDTNFELAVRVPLIVSIPWMVRAVDLSPSSLVNQDKNNIVQSESNTYSSAIIASSKTPSVNRITDFFELLDLFPTISGLMNLTRPKHLQGIDQSNLLISQLVNHSPLGRRIRDAAFSQVIRCSLPSCSNAPLSTMYAVGYTVRTNQWRYTVFFSATDARAKWNEPVLSEELYDHSNDAETLFRYSIGTNYDSVENINVASEHPEICIQLLALIRDRYEFPIDI